VGAVNVLIDVSGAPDVMSVMRECMEKTEKMDGDGWDLFGASTTKPYSIPPLFQFHTFHVT
jgi:hypothetical protein